LKSDDSKQLQRIKVFWLLLRNFPIYTLRLRQFSLLMKRNSFLELGLQRHGGAILRLKSGTTAFDHCYSSRAASDPIIV
jgi:hypothetical protein